MEQLTDPFLLSAAASSTSQASLRRARTSSPRASTPWVRPPPLLPSPPLSYLSAVLGAGTSTVPRPPCHPGCTLLQSCRHPILPVTASTFRCVLRFASAGPGHTLGSGDCPWFPSVPLSLSTTLTPPSQMRPAPIPPIALSALRTDALSFPPPDAALLTLLPSFMAFPCTCSCTFPETFFLLETASFESVPPLPPPPPPPPLSEGQALMYFSLMALRVFIRLFHRRTHPSSAPSPPAPGFLVGMQPVCPSTTPL